jgi:hypothetical protein
MGNKKFKGIKQQPPKAACNKKRYFLFYTGIRQGITEN